MTWRKTALENTCKEMATDLAGLVKKAGEELVPARKLGFALILFDLGDGGEMSYMSNGRREDMIKCLKELLGHLDPGQKGN
jgi:hypothetical protein